MADPPSSLPTGAYITIGLLIALTALLSWLIASYPGKPPERSVTDDCESITQQYSHPEGAGRDTRSPPTAIKNNKPAPHPPPPIKPKMKEIQKGRSPNMSANLQFTLAISPILQNGWCTPLLD